MDVQAVELTEVGPREGFQFEGIGHPEKIATGDKVRLVEALAATGLKTIEVTSFVSPRRVPQMADAEALSAMLRPHPGVRYAALYLNRQGLERALATGRYALAGRVSLTASETFSQRNQGCSLEQEIAEQRRIMALCQEKALPVRTGSLMAAFGCNYEGDIPLSKVLDLIDRMHQLAAEFGESLEVLKLNDTMGWADPEQIKRTVGAVRERWPQLDIVLHLHDTRGAGMANVYAALEVGVRRFETSVGGLGGCPFAGVVAGNVPTEDVVFLCQRLGIETGIDLERLVGCVRLAEEIVGHSLPGRVGHVMKDPRE